MTSEGLADAMQFVAEVIRLASDPVARARLRLLQAEVDGTADWLRRFDPVEGYEKEATKGTCPTCGRQYAFAGDQGGLRRHGKGRCALDTQLAEELAPAVWLIANMDAVSTEGNSDDGTRHSDTDNV